MTPARAFSGAVGIVVTVLLNLSWVALVGLAGLAVAVWIGRAVIWALGGA